MHKKSFMPPDTSLQAHDGVIERKQKITHADIIMNALKVKKFGNYEEIAMFCNLTSMQVIRRLSELEKAGKIFRTGRTSKTFSGDRGEVWAILEKPSVTQQQTLFAA